MTRAATIAAAGTATAAAASTAPSAVALPLAHYSHIVLDPAHGPVSISGGPGTNSIIVTDYIDRTVASQGQSGIGSIAPSVSSAGVTFAATGEPTWRRRASTTARPTRTRSPSPRTARGCSRSAPTTTTTTRC